MDLNKQLNVRFVPGIAILTDSTLRARKVPCGGMLMFNGTVPLFMVLSWSALEKEELTLSLNLTEKFPLC